MKKHLLLGLMLLVTALTATTFLISTYAFKAQERTMASMMRSYLMDLLDGFAEVPTESEPHRMGRGRTRMGMMRYRMLLNTPPLQGADAGGILLLEKDGTLLAASPGAERLLALWKGPLKTTEPLEVRAPWGHRYYIATREAGNGFVLAAVSKTLLLAPVAGVGRFWMALIRLTSAVVLLGVVALWRFLVAPLRNIAEIIRKMRWGRECPRLPSKGVFELQALTQVIGALAEEAVAKEELKIHYVSDLVRVQENEGKRLARDLHDGPLQGVVAAIKRIQLAQQTAAQGSETYAELTMAEDVCQNAANEIRSYCDALSPSWVKLGLVSAMQENADRLSRVYGVAIDLEIDERLDATSEEHVLALVRILQEAASNSVRHGGATRLSVELRQEEGRMLFGIRDDGKGFEGALPSEETDYEHLRTTGHRGLANMNERVRMLRGTMCLESRPGQGCGIRIAF